MDQPEIRRAKPPEVSSGGFLAGFRLDQNPHDVALLHDQVFGVVDLDLRAGPFAEQHPIACLEAARDELAALIASTRANGDDFALARLFLDGVGNDDTSSALCLGLDTLDHDSIVKRTEFHVSLLVVLSASFTQAMLTCAP